MLIKLLLILTLHCLLLSAETSSLEKSLDRFGVATGSTVTKKDCLVIPEAANTNTQYINTSTVRGQKHMMILGDSITFSNCNGKENGLCGWREFLTEKCHQSKNFYSFDTFAKVGISAREVSARLPIFQNDYDAAMILLGTNDIGDGSGSIEALKANYNKLIAKLKSQNIKEIFFMSVFPTCAYGKSTRELTSQKIQEVNKYLKELAASNPDISFIDVYDNLQSKTKPGCLDETIDSGDHLHPKTNKATQTRIAELIASKLNPKLDCK